MRTRACVCACVCVRVRVRVRASARTYLSLLACVRLCVRVRPRLLACVLVCVCACVRMRASACVHALLCAGLRAGGRGRVCVCVCVFFCCWQRSFASAWAAPAFWTSKAPSSCKREGGSAVPATPKWLHSTALHLSTSTSCSTRGQPWPATPKWLHAPAPSHSCLQLSCRAIALAFTSSSVAPSAPLNHPASCG